MLGADFETVRDVALGIVVGAVVLALLVAFVVKAIVSKLVVIVLLAGLALIVWQQRGSVEDCAANVRRHLAAGARDTTTCRFLGRDVTVDSPFG